MDGDFLWPQPSGHFFEHNRTRDDTYSWLDDPQVKEFASHYLESAKVLIDLACDAPGLVNRYAIPAVFLFRHFVELTIKDLVLKALELNEENPDFDDRHGLLAPYTQVRRLIEQADLLDMDVDKELFDLVGTMIAELDEIDASSMAFRYPVGKADKKSGQRAPLLGEQFGYFDMLVFRDQAMRLANVLDAVGDQLAHWLELKREIDEAYRFE